MEPNPTQHIPTPKFAIIIEFDPSRGQLKVAWPEIDDIIKMGMLQMAMSMLQEARLKAAPSNTSGLVIPRVS